MNKHDNDVGDDIRRTRFDKFPIIFVRTSVFPAKLTHKLRFLGIRVPTGVAVNIQKIFVIFEKLREARPRDVGQKEFALLPAPAIEPSTMFCFPLRAA